MVTIGIDPHQASHTAVALATDGEVLGELCLRADAVMLDRLRQWAIDWPDRVWAIEGAAGLGRLLAQKLVGAGERVLDVPAALCARVRVLARGHGRKTDGIDARSVALVALHQPGLLEVAVDDHTALLRLLSDRRDELTGERRRSINRLHRMLRDLHPGGAACQLTAERAAQLLRSIRPCGAIEQERKAIARQLINDVRRIDRALAENRRRCQQAVAASGSSLTEILGISDVLAAKILATPATSPALPAPLTTPATPAPHPSKPQAASERGTVSPAPATAHSTTPCTWPPASKRCTPAPAEPTASANKPSTRPRPKRYAASSDSSPRSSTARSATTNTAPRRFPSPQT